jgi:hypothetical protein
MKALLALPSDMPPVAKAKLPATYEGAKVALAACSRLDECQDWADKAEALASYAKQAQDEELRKMADRIQPRAIRRCGELLQQIQAASGTRTDLEPGPAAPTRSQVAREAGLTRHQHHTAVRVARLPDPEFESAVEDDDPATVTALAQRGTTPKALSKEAQVRAFRERQAEQTEARATPSAPTPDVGELSSVLSMLRGDPKRIANLSMGKRVALARVCLAFLNLTLDDLRAGAP